MGVPYKLKKESVDFIVHSKKNNPALSCRKLVEMFKDQYGLDVSKSSINDVIKEYNLSSPVGRHSVYIAPKNFSIPQEKKQSLFKNVLPFLKPEEFKGHSEPGFHPEPEVQAAPAMSLESKIDSDLRHEMRAPAETGPVVPANSIQAVDSNKVTDSPVIDSAMLLRPDPISWTMVSEDADVHQPPAPEEVVAEVCSQAVEDKEQEVAEGKASAWLGDVGMLYERLGAAALWFIFRAACANSRLGDMVARALGDLPEGVTAQQCEAVFFAGLFGEHRPGFESDDLRTLWRLTGLDDIRGRALLEKIHVLGEVKPLMAALRVEIAMAFTPVRYFRLLTSKGARFYIDAALPVLHGDFIDAGQVSQMLPIFIAVERAVDGILTNSVPLVAELPGQGLSPKALNFMQLMECLGDDELVSVELIGDNDVKCVELTMVPRMRRAFIFQASLNAAERSRVEYHMIANRKNFLDEVSGSSFGYFEGHLVMEGLERPLRVLSVKPQEGDEFVLLSNISTIGSSGDDVLAQYFALAGIKNMGIASEIRHDIGLFTPKQSNICDVYRDLDTLLQEFVLRKTNTSFPWEEMCQILYDLPGHIKDQPKALLIRFQLPEIYPYRRLLSSILTDLNRAVFKAPDGRRVFFSAV
ncbi:MAG: hypothetical protein HQL22_06670 [Candidatus Omnitrophica bacterium]|nr:hypothetical protein [Candidatus Omnitrophota bacterium]